MRLRSLNSVSHRFSLLTPFFLRHGKKYGKIPFRRFLPQLVIGNKNQSQVAQRLSVRFDLADRIGRSIGSRIVKLRLSLRREGMERDTKKKEKKNETHTVGQVGQSRRRLGDPRTRLYGSKIRQRVVENRVYGYRRCALKSAIVSARIGPQPVILDESRSSTSRSRLTFHLPQHNRPI